MPPILNRLLCIGGILLVLFVLIMHASPRVYSHIYRQGWEDAERHYQKHCPPKKFKYKKASPKKGIRV
jgi:hypothetical protein